jgi:Tol biopolymer transport system component
MNPDGSGMRQLTTAPGPQSLLGWSPDGSQALVVETMMGGEQMLQLVSLADGQITPILPISGKRSYAAISPDGEWLAYSEKPFGERGQAVYVSRLDGSEQRLVAQLEHWVAFAPTWSPDGKWLMISIFDTDSYESHDAQLALVSPWTCEVIPLAGLSGEIRSWVENR